MGCDGIFGMGRDGIFGMGLVLISKNDPNPKWDWDSMLKFGIGSVFENSVGINPK